MNSKQRAYLRSQANALEPVVQIGKDGITDHVMQSIEEAIRKRELIKVRFLENSGMKGREIADQIAERIHGDCVQVIGSVFVLYRANDKNPIYQLPKA